MRDLLTVTTSYTQKCMDSFYRELEREMLSAAAIQAALTSEPDRNYDPYHCREFNLIADHQATCTSSTRLVWS